MNDSLKNNLVIMFSDVAGSTKIYDTLGDAAAEKCIADSLKMMSKVVEAHSGQVVKTIGDEIMARFNSSDDSFAAAKEIQVESEHIEIDHFTSVQVRIGMHAGQVIERDNDIFGDAVNIAARLAGVAKAGQIMISEDLYEQLNAENKDSSRLFDRARVKGKDQAFNIYQVVWEDLNQTSIINAQDSAAIAAAAAPKGGLRLSHNGNGTFISNDDGGKAFSIGRGATCDLMIQSDHASRSHLEIVWERNKFILTDHSTNGTRVTMENGETIFLKRESCPLIGKGSFTLGVDDNNQITYESLSGE